MVRQALLSPCVGKQLPNPHGKSYKRCLGWATPTQIGIVDELRFNDPISVFGYPPSDVYDGLRLRTLTLFPSSQNFGIIRHGRT
ncbi:hypothetical protein IQ274_11990 [Nostoc sp. LEGE 12447]|uniref:hypothetical protein n=1 Tax=Nostoc sp. LEGE 12447 TaxID=1828640 RepID=UPI0018832CE1|nr:hypothetical protein [Nostoc sp. LEGE 12447]MBE8998910.1 hypothetical protein [Nostoc sp. LEGE 12447]